MVTFVLLIFKKCFPNKLTKECVVKNFNFFLISEMNCLIRQTSTQFYFFFEIKKKSNFKFISYTLFQYFTSYTEIHTYIILIIYIVVILYIIAIVTNEMCFIFLIKFCFKILRCIYNIFI